MIYVLVPFVGLAVWHYVRLGQRAGAATLGRELLRTLLAGVAAGLLVALGARLGMRLIAIANEAPPRISWRGTSVVFAAYTGVGVLCAVLYVAVFRSWLRRRGTAFGALLVITTWYPLAHSGAQQLVHPPPLASLVIWSGAVVALMWLPYAVLLEVLLARWSDRVAAID
jgi:hypothetical protein